MIQTETRTVTPLGENIIRAFNDTANKLSTLGQKSGSIFEAYKVNTTEEWEEWNTMLDMEGKEPISFDEFTNLLEDTWIFGVRELYLERVYIEEEGRFEESERQRTVFSTTDFDEFHRKTADYVSHMIKNEDLYEELRQKTSEALKDIFRERPELEKVDIFLERGDYDVMGVGAVRNAEGGVEDVLIHFYDGGFTYSVTPSCRYLLDVDTLYSVYDSVRNELGLGDDPRLYELSIAADVEFCEECHILYGGEE